MTKQCITSGIRTTAKTHLYIDGTNLFAGQNELFGPKRYALFPDILRDIQKIFLADHVYFYASYMVGVNFKRPGRKALIAAEAQFYHSARNTPSLTFYRGHRSPTSGKEKGVDVHLAVDMVMDALLHHYDEAVVFSGDADLSYAVESVRALDVPVHAVFLPNRFAPGIAYAATSSVVLNYKKKFVKEKILVPKSLTVLALKDPACKHTG